MHLVHTLLLNKTPFWLMYHRLHTYRGSGQWKWVRVIAKALAATTTTTTLQFCVNFGSKTLEFVSFHFAPLHSLLPIILTPVWPNAKNLSSIFGCLEKWKFAQWHEIFWNGRLKMLPSTKWCPRLLQFYQSGEISPNLLTLLDTFEW